MISALSTSTTSGMAPYMIWVKGERVRILEETGNWKDMKGVMM